MKKQITAASALIIAAVILGASQLARAQTAQRLVVDVPFEFVAAGRQLPAGRYTVSRITNTEGALFIRSEDGRFKATVLTNASGRARADAKLTFKQYGDRYFLSGVGLLGTSGARTLRESGQERSLRAQAGRAEAKIVALR